ncbi:GYDIA family GHMP kinase [Tenacibaculum sp. UWU-22]|uniref:GYDIA family GHMP kinase n=1 Tax=Tenacibaculum sp. UWU-22 TaxID=3234187 RepID=UPI0034DB1419
MVEKYYSNGKLLLTAEYVVLDGAKSLAIPTKFGQDLIVEPIKEPQLVWNSYTNTGECWFQAIFDLPKLRLISTTYNSDKEGSAEFIAETLYNILQEAQKLNPSFLSAKHGFVVKTNLTFPQKWGLGSSSTLINNIAMWAEVNPFTLLWHTFSGSGYDIACAQHNTPITYQIVDKYSQSKPLVVEEVKWSQNFEDELFFIYLNQKQNSREGIKRYKEYKEKIPLSEVQTKINQISTLSEQFIKTNTINDLDKIIVEHEQIISSIIKINPIKSLLFKDYFGQVKSLGAWGGDFVLATGNEDTPAYFKQKGFDTILPYKKMIL